MVPHGLPHGALELLSQVVVSALRALLFAGAVGLTLEVLRVRRAAIRLCAWVIVLYAALAMPILYSALPGLRWSLPALALTRPTLPVGTPSAEAPVTTRFIDRPIQKSLSQSTLGSLITDQAGKSASVSLPSPPTLSRPLRGIARRSIPWGDIALAIYFVGLLILLLRAALGWMFALRLERAANTIQDPNALGRLRCYGDAFGLKHLPRLAEAEPLSVPLTLSVLHPVILLPPNWQKWNASQLDAVLAHELAHVSRGDMLTQRLSLLHRAIFWFSPLGWWLHRRLADLAEHASDEVALHAGADQGDYAQMLLGFFAETSSRRRVRWQAVSMAREAGVARRIERILTWKDGLSPRLTRALVIGMASVAAPTVLLIASLRPTMVSARMLPSHLAQKVPTILSAAVPTPLLSSARLPLIAPTERIIFDDDDDTARTVIHYPTTDDANELAWLSASSGQGATDVPYDGYVRQVQGVVADEQNYVVLDEDIWLHARRDLADLRLFAGDQEVPYALMVQRGSESAQRADTRLVSVGRVNGETQIVIDMTGTAEYDALSLRLADTARDFVVRAHVEGLDSPEQPTGVDLGDPILFDFSREYLGSDFTLRIRSATFRFLRVRLPQITPEQVLRAIAINTHIRTSSWTPISAALPIEQEGRTTVVTWEASEPVPVARVVLDVDPSQVNFRRDVEVLTPSGGTVTNSSIGRIHLVRAGSLVESESLAIDLPKRLGELSRW